MVLKQHDVPPTLHTGLDSRTVAQSKLSGAGRRVGVGLLSAAQAVRLGRVPLIFGKLLSCSMLDSWTPEGSRQPARIRVQATDSTHFPLVKTCLAFDIHNYAISTNKHIFNYSKCVIGHYVMLARRTYSLINIFWTIIPGSMLYYLIKKYCMH